MNRDFKGVWIPKEIWLDESLSALDKIIFAEIDSLDNEDHCWASNAHLAKFCQCSESKVSKSIKTLTDRGYIRVVAFDGRKRVLQSCLAFSTRQTSKIYEADQEKMPVSNTGSNTPRKERKKEAAKGSYNETIKAYTENEDLRNALVEFVKMRKLMKSPLTDRALALLLSKLDKMEATDARKTEVVNQSIERGWKGFFPLKDGGKTEAKKEAADAYLEANKDNGWGDWDWNS